MKNIEQTDLKITEHRNIFQSNRASSTDEYHPPCHSLQTGNKNLTRIQANANSDLSNKQVLSIKAEYRLSLAPKVPIETYLATPVPSCKKPSTNPKKAKQIISSPCFYADFCLIKSK